MQSTW